MSGPFVGGRAGGRAARRGAARRTCRARRCSRWSKRCSPDGSVRATRPRSSARSRRRAAAPAARSRRGAPRPRSRTVAQVGQSRAPGTRPAGCERAAREEQRVLHQRRRAELAGARARLASRRPRRVELAGAQHRRELASSAPRRAQPTLATARSNARDRQRDQRRVRRRNAPTRSRPPFKAGQRPVVVLGERRAGRGCTSACSTSSAPAGAAGCSRGAGSRASVPASASACSASGASTRRLVVRQRLGGRRRARALGRRPRAGRRQPRTSSMPQRIPIAVRTIIRRAWPSRWTIESMRPDEIASAGPLRRHRGHARYGCGRGHVVVKRPRGTRPSVVAEVRSRLREACARCDPHEHPDAADLLRTEHAAVRVLASAESEAEAYPALLAAIGTSLGCAGALAAAPSDGGCTAPQAWPADAAAAAELAAASGSTASPPPVRAAPRRSRSRSPASASWASRPPRRSSPTRTCCATMDSLGVADLAVRRALPRRAGGAGERRAQDRDPRLRLRLHHHDGPRAATWSRSTARPRARSATAREEMIGRELAELIVPPSWRERAPRGRRSAPAHGALGGRRPPARGDGDARRRQRVPGRADRHPPARPRSAAVLRLPARRHRGAHARARRCAGSPPSRPRCGAWPRRSRAESDPRDAFAVVTEEVGAPARRAEREHGPLQRRRDGDGRRRAGARATSATCRSATRVRDRRRHAPRRAVFRTRAPARVDSYDELDGELAATAARARLPLRRRRARSSSAAGCGAR